MESVEFLIRYIRPNIDDFLAGNNHYNNRHRSKAEAYPFLFEYLCSPLAYIAMVQATESSRPAVAGIAKACVDLLLDRTGSGTTGEINKFIGAVVGYILTINGYEKIGKQRSIGHRDFTTGEVYRRKG